MTFNDKKRTFTILLLSCFLTFCFSGFPVFAAALTSVGTQISNIATLSYKDPGGYQYTTSSNPAVITVSGAPLLIVSKTGQPNPVSPGEELTYIIEYANAGNVSAENVVLTDNLPDGPIFLGATGDSGENQGVISWNIGNLEPDESGIVEIKAKIDEALNPGDKINNVASITDSTGTVVTSPPSEITIGQAPNLLLNKTANVDTIESGSNIIYSIQYTNIGNMTATNVMITDQLPMGTTFVSASDGGIENRRIITWSIGNLASGKSGNVQMNVKTGSDIRDGFLISNIAHISSTEGASALSNQVDARVSKIQVGTTGILEVTPSIIPGEKINLTLTDADLNKNVNLIETIELATINDVTGEKELLTYTETGANTGIFTATVDTAYGINAGTNDDGLFNVQANDTLTTTYNDELTDTGDSATITATTDVTGGFTGILEATPSISAGESVSLSLFDKDLNKDSNSVEIIELTTINTATGETEILTYTETGVNTGVFVATVETAYGKTAGTNNDGEFNVKSGDTLNTNYKDEFIDTGGAKFVNASTSIVSTAPAKIILVPDPDTILGDGKDSSKLTAKVLDADGNPVTDGTIVTFTTTHGKFSNDTQEIKVPTKDGEAITYLTAEIVSNIPVETFAKATAGTEQTGIVEDEVKIIFSPGAIAGTVTSQIRETLLARAEVTVTDREGNLIGDDITDSDGNYMVFIPKTGEYNVYIKAKDERNNEVTFTENVNVYAVFGAVFEPSNVISGIVSDSKTGEVIENVSLRLLDEQGKLVLDESGNPIVINTDKNGEYSIQGLKPGEYTVEIQNTPEGYYRHGYINVEASKDGQFLVDVNLPLDPYGIVYDALTNELIEGATVTLFDFDTDEMTSLPLYLGEKQLNPEITEEDGYYDYFVWPGEYYLTAVAPGYYDFKSEKIVVVKDIVNLDIPLVPMPELKFTKTVDKSIVKPGEFVTYTLGYENSGSAASNTIITDMIPDNTSFISASDNGTADNGIVKWSLGTLEYNQTGSVKLTVEVSPLAKNDSVIENTANIISDETEPLSASAISKIEIPVLTMNKSVSPAIVDAGKRLNYTISFRNGGSADATNVQIRDNIPENTTFVSATENGNLQNGTVIWNIGALQPSDSRQVKVVLEVDSPLPNGTQITNSAIIQSDEISEIQANAIAEVRSMPILKIEKKADRTEALPGDLVNYTLSYKNVGNAIATDVILSDALSENIEYFDGGSYDESSRTVQWQIGSLPPSDRDRNVVFRAKVKEDLEPGLYEIQNTAELAASEVQTVESNAVFTSILVPYIKLTKTANKRIADIGDIVTYMLTITNLSSNSDLVHVEIEDFLPRGFGYIEETGIVDGKSTIKPLKDKNRVVFSIDKISRSQNITVSYSLSVGANADLGDGINKAKASGYTPELVNRDKGLQLASNEAEWEVQIREGFFSDKGIILGKVFVDDNGDGFQTKDEKGVANIRLIMEDGTIVVTDENGKYSIPEVDSGLHVIRIDETSLPDWHEPVQQDVKFAGNPNIQFVRVSSPAQADFTLKKTPPRKSETTIPIVIQPTAPILIPEPHVTIVQPKPVITRNAMFRPIKITQPSQPVFIEPEVSVSQPSIPPEIMVRFEPARIPSGDPEIIVRTNVELKRVVAIHPDGEKFELKLAAPTKYEWRSHFLVPFDIPDGPYPFTILQFLLIH